MKNRSQEIKRLQELAGITVGTELPLSTEVRDHIDRTITQLKKNSINFDNLVNNGYFQNQFHEYILNKFVEEYPDAYSLDQEVVDYIDTMAS